MLIKTIAGVALFALAGAAIGYSQILCANGECAITGTPYGGALFGGILGMAVMSSIGNTIPAAKQDPQANDELAQDQSDHDKPA